MGENDTPNEPGSISLLEPLLEYRKEILEERWLTTHILYAHL